LVYALLHRRRLALADLPAYVERVGLHREFNRRYFRLTPEAYAEWLVTALEKAGAVRREGDFLVPA
ncbi:MAG TPA: MBL fold metallo-hydrolase, partial [Thermoanaerobaculia bacterium]